MDSALAPGSPNTGAAAPVRSARLHVKHAVLLTLWDYNPIEEWGVITGRYR